MPRNTKRLLRKKKIIERRSGEIRYIEATSTVMAFGGGSESYWDLKDLNICTFPRPSTCAQPVYALHTENFVINVHSNNHAPPPSLMIGRLRLITSRILVAPFSTNT